MGRGHLASADGLRFVVPVRTINAGPNPRYFGQGRGVTWLNYLSDQVFALFHLLGYQCSPRLADLADQRFWRLERGADYEALNEVSRNQVSLRSRKSTNELLLRRRLSHSTRRRFDAARQETPACGTGRRGRTFAQVSENREVLSMRRSLTGQTEP